MVKNEETREREKVTVVMSGRKTREMKEGQGIEEGDMNRCLSVSGSVTNSV